VLIISHQLPTKVDNLKTKSSSAVSRTVSPVSAGQ
jgi:hypothetical protein